MQVSLVELSVTKNEGPWYYCTMAHPHGALYVSGTIAELAEQLKSDGFSTLSDGGGGMIMVEACLKADDFPEWAESSALLQQLSEKYQQVLAFYDTDQSDWYLVSHWKHGNIVRHLLFADGLWEECSGQPEPWESTCFFNEDALRQALEDQASELSGEELELANEQLQKRWQEQRMELQTSTPYPHEMIHAFLAFHSLKSPY
jgi:hypothetical protein